MEEQLSLTRSIAALIVEAVAEDPECRRLIPKSYDSAPISNPASRALGRAMGKAGIAGSARNMSHLGAFLIPGYQPSQEESDEACTGIAAAAMEALNAAAGDPTFPVASADTVSRKLGVLKVEHTATKVTLRSGESYVFDWHATLMIENPMVHPSVDAWMNGLDGVLFSQWTGRRYARFSAAKK
jgi:hypothetical protein